MTRCIKIAFGAGLMDRLSITWSNPTSMTTVNWGHRDIICHSALVRSLVQLRIESPPVAEIFFFSFLSKVKKNESANFLLSLSRISILPDIDVTLLNYIRRARITARGKSDKTLKMSRDILTR